MIPRLITSGVLAAIAGAAMAVAVSLGIEPSERPDQTARLSNLNFEGT